MLLLGTIALGHPCPEVEVPLPLWLGLVTAPVVGESARGVAELAAGSPVTAPRPLGAPPWASAEPTANKLTIVAANTARICVLLGFAG
jgi:hypothetical protein